jgi:hypothetical protein
MGGIPPIPHRAISTRRSIHKVRGAIDRDVVSIPELLLDAEQLAQRPQTYLAPIINSLWQAGGHSACPRYLEGGTYDPLRTYA